MDAPCCEWDFVREVGQSFGGERACVPRAAACGACAVSISTHRCCL